MLAFAIVAPQKVQEGCQQGKLRPWRKHPHRIAVALARDRDRIALVLSRAPSRGACDVECVKICAALSRHYVLTRFSVQQSGVFTDAHALSAGWHGGQFTIPVAQGCSGQYHAILQYTRASLSAYPRPSCACEGPKTSSFSCMHAAASQTRLPWFTCWAARLAVRLPSRCRALAEQH